MNELQDYVATRSQQAFAAIVDRYADLVYASAVRHVNDRALAEDITQGVFALLAQKAARIAPGRPLSAWLLTTTRYLAMNERRLRANRRKLEQTVAMNERSTTATSNEPDWSELGPMVDEGLSKLRAGDRDVLMLRYFERQTIRDVASAIGTTEEAASKRVQRALERLRKFFHRRGVTAADVTPALTMLAGTSAAPEALRATLVAMSASTAKTSAGIVATAAAFSGGKAAVAAAILICGAGVIAYTRPAAPTPATSVPVASTQNAAGEPELRAARAECFPREVCDVILAERMRMTALLAFEGKALQTQAYALDARAMGWLAVVFPQLGTGDNVLQMGNTSLSGPCAVFTETDTLIPVNRVRSPGGGLSNYRVSARVSEPWAVGEVKKFCWLLKDGQHSPRGDGRVPFYMSNGPGFNCTQQLALVTTKHWRLTSSSQEPTSSKRVGEYIIYFWEREVTGNEIFRVDAEVRKTDAP